MKRIELTKGQFTLVDDADFEYLNQWKWYASDTCNHTYKAKRNNNRKTVLMHRVIMGDSKLFVDHIDGNPLNNQRHNLRFVTHGQNMINRKLHSTSTSGYRGVHWDKKSQKWMSNLKLNNKWLYFGLFTSPIAAAMVRDMAVKDLCGEYGKLNFPDAIHGVKGKINE